MSGIWIWWVLTWFVGIGWSRPAQNPKLAMAERMTQQGLYLYALKSLDETIAKGLGDADVYAYRGMVLTLRGQYQYAIADFESGMGAVRMDGRDGEAYAYAKAVRGECAQEDFESIRHFGNLPRGANIRILSTEVEVQRYCQNPLEATDVQHWMALEFPHAVKTHLAAADLALDRGDIDEAWRVLFNAQLHYQYVGIRDVLARIALMEGNYDEAFQQMQYIGAQRVSDRSMILNGLSMMLSGNHAFWIHKMDQPRWRATENPHLVYLLMWAFYLDGDPVAYQNEKAWYNSICDRECQAIVQRNLEMEIQGPLPVSLP